jgi:hypothetical protein
MKTEAKNPIKYFLLVNGQEYCVNTFLEKNIIIKFEHQINCINCGKSIKKTFFQGYCYNCFSTLPQADPSVINPELNRAHEGISRDMEWSKKYDLTEHYVYLSVTDAVKVGVTRIMNIPSRWIDQGAEYAIKFAKTPYRQLAGVIEVEMKNYLNDKTNWRKMLSDSVTDIPDLMELKELYATYLPEELQQFICDDDKITELKYPVIKYPEKIKSINLDKTDEYSGILTGIKGQYLIFDDGHVFNIRKHNGYKVSIEIY